MNFEYYWPQFSNGKRQAGRIDQEKNPSVYCLQKKTF